MSKITVEYEEPMVIMLEEEHKAILETIEILSSIKLTKNVEKRLNAFHDSNSKNYIELRDMLRSITKRKVDSPSQ